MKLSGIFALLFLPLAMQAQTHQPMTPGNDPKQFFVFPDNIRISRQELNERLEAKTAELSHCFQLLAQKRDPNYAATIKRAMQLFNNDDQKVVTVTGKRYPKPVTKPVRKYLNDLTKLKYDKVTIMWHNAQYVSKFTKQPDGNYSAIVAFEQEFTGVKSGEANYTYHDVTQKRIEVSVKVWDKENADGVKTKSYIDVYLGNIGVTEE